MRLVVSLLVLLSGGACAPRGPLSPTGGPWRFSGAVVQLSGTQTGKPIAGAELTVVSGTNKNARVTSDANGHYSFINLEAGRFTVAIAAVGYASATPVVDLYHDVEATFALKPLR